MIITKKHFWNFSALFPKSFTQCIFGFNPKLQTHELHIDLISCFAEWLLCLSRLSGNELRAFWLFSPFVFPCAFATPTFRPPLHSPLFRFSPSFPSPPFVLSPLSHTSQAYVETASVYKWAGSNEPRSPTGKGERKDVGSGWGLGSRLVFRVEDLGFRLSGAGLRMYVVCRV